MEKEIDTDLDNLNLRIHRAESWLRRGEAETDADAKYIFLWIAFNAAYGVSGKDKKDKEVRENYLRTLVPLDKKHKIYGLLATKLLSPVLDIMKNVYLFDVFWDNLTDPPFDWNNWTGKGEFEGDYVFVEGRLPDPPATGSPKVPIRVEPIDTKEVLSLLLRLFRRLNVLRNQLMHGSATQDGSLNRRQVDAGANVLGPLVRVFLDIMVANPKEGWGPPRYPVRNDIREDR